MKRTRKWSAAIAYSGITGSLKDRPEDLYKALNEQGVYWDSDQGLWELNNQPADPATQLIRIRIWAAAEKIPAAVDDIKVMLAPFYDLLEQSDPYPCRPPKQLESRVYLTFKRKEY